MSKKRQASGKLPSFPEAENRRERRREEERGWLILVLATLLLLGGGLIALIFGPTALLTALPCLLGGAGLIFIPWFILTLLEKWRAD